jgi:hypothetical protein
MAADVAAPIDTSQSSGPQVPETRSLEGSASRRWDDALQTHAAGVLKDQFPIIVQVFAEIDAVVSILGAGSSAARFDKYEALGSPEPTERLRTQIRYTGIS